MLTALNKTFFNKRTTCKLSGINERQFDYFIKYVGLIEDKGRYNLNNIIYIAICNSLRNIGLTWQDIYKIVHECSTDDVSIKGINYINYDVLAITHCKNDEISYTLIPKDDFFIQKVKKDGNENNFIVYLRKGQEIEKTTKYSILISTLEKDIIYVVLIFRIINEIVNKSKELNLKVDIEKILSA